MIDPVGQPPTTLTSCVVVDEQVPIVTLSVTEWVPPPSVKDVVGCSAVLVVEVGMGTLAGAPKGPL